MSALAKMREEALSLSEDERLELAADLVASVHANPDPEWQAAWTAECDRRIEAQASGKAKAILWNEVKAEFEARFGNR